MRVGILGAGQLGKMLSWALKKRGDSVVFFDSDANACARNEGDFIHAAFDDFAELDTLIAATDILTCEFENIPYATLAYVAQRQQLLPNPRSFQTTQDRLLEKKLFNELAIPTPQFYPINTLESFDTIGNALQQPIVKTRHGGYDGKGQFSINQAKSIFETTPLMAEERIDFDFEVSLIGCRTNRNATFLPLQINHHTHGILHSTVAGVVMDAALTQQAQQYWLRVAENLNYQGVLSLEFFVRNNVLLANEYAPRVHNSGHWSLDGAQHSQFDLHAAAIHNDVIPHNDFQPTLMINCIGAIPTTPLPEFARLYDYSKSARPDRKMGHINCVANSIPQLHEYAKQLSSLLDEEISNQLFCSLATR